jgi:hypothetical protein
MVWHQQLLAALDDAEGVTGVGAGVGAAEVITSTT